MSEIETRTSKRPKDEERADPVTAFVEALADALVDAMDRKHREGTVARNLMDTPTDSNRKSDTSLSDSLLAEILAELKLANVKARLWNVGDVADYFLISNGSAHNRLLCKPNFLRAVKVAGIGRRWMPAEVKAFAERHRQKRT